MTILFFLFVTFLAAVGVFTAVWNSRHGSCEQSSKNKPPLKTLDTSLGRVYDVPAPKNTAPLSGAGNYLEISSAPSPSQLHVTFSPAQARILDEDGNIDWAEFGRASAHFGSDPRLLAEWIAAELNGDWFPSKVAGVSHRNDDRTSRQAAIKKMCTFDILDLIPDSENKFDSNAICVIGGYFAKNSEFVERQVGFLNSRLAGETSRAMKRGTRFLCFVLEVTGVSEKTRGLNIALIRWQEQKTMEAVT